MIVLFYIFHIHKRYSHLCGYLFILLITLTLQTQIPGVDPGFLKGLCVCVGGGGGGVQLTA